MSVMIRSQSFSPAAAIADFRRRCPADERAFAHHLRGDRGEDRIVLDEQDAQALRRTHARIPAPWTHVRVVLGAQIAVLMSCR